MAWCGSPDSLFAEPSNRLARKIDPDTLHLRVEFQSVTAHLAAITGLLVTAKRRSGIEHVVGIDPDKTGLDGLGETRNILGA